MRSAKKKIGCLGFSANPPHLGHLGLAESVLDKKLVDQVWLIPCHTHSFDKSLAPAKHRLQMARFLEGDKIKINHIESSRKNKSYAIDTVMALKRKHPRFDFFWILGTDIIKDRSYLRWKNWEMLSRTIKFMVLERAGFEVEKMPPPFIFAGKGLGRRISSSEIRDRIKTGRDIKGFVPDRVREYIAKHHLYQ